MSIAVQVATQPNIFNHFESVIVLTFFLKNYLSIKEQLNARGSPVKCSIGRASKRQAKAGNI